MPQANENYDDLADSSQFHDDGDQVYDNNYQQDG